MRNFENEFETKNRKTGTVTAVVITVVVLLLLLAAQKYEHELRTYCPLRN